MTCRSREGTADGLFLAVKGGHNGESHNHNDVGEFLVYADGEPLLIDPGVGEYTAKTFSAERYSIWTMQSQYHNLPQINGFDQHDGQQYAARVIDCKGQRLTLDLAAAYPEEAAVTAWKRTVELRHSREVRVTEDYRLARYVAPTSLMLMTTAQPQLLRPGHIVLTSGKNTTGSQASALETHVLSFNPQQLQPAIEDITPLLSPLLSDMWGPHLYRIVLTLRSPSLQGRVSYSVK